jgi:hypothetical protein
VTLLIMLVLLHDPDTIVFTGWLSDHVHRRPGCTYAGTTAGRYIAWAPWPCPAERLAHLQRVSPMRVGSTEWYWIQRKRAALQAKR